jgi:hypothetical protein
LKESTIVNYVKERKKMEKEKKETICDITERCGKIIYPDANKVHGLVMEKRKEGIKLNYYYCEYCLGFHTTSMTMKQQRQYLFSIEKSHRYRRKKEESK